MKRTKRRDANERYVRSGEGGTVPGISGSDDYEGGMGTVL